MPWLRKSEEPEQAGREIIRGEKIVLREKRLEDAVDDYAWRTDEELARLDAARPLMMSYEAFLRYSKEEFLYRNPSSKRLAIDTHDGRHIGNCMYYDVSTKRGEAEVGIMIGDRAYWEKGYGADSVDTLVTHIFTTTSLNRIYLHTLDWNVRARRSFAKAGLCEVKNVHRSGKDFVLMEVRRPEWEGRREIAENAAVVEQDPSQDGRSPSEGGTTPVGTG